MSALLAAVAIAVAFALMAIAVAFALMAIAMAWADPAGDWLAGMREMVEERREHARE